MAESDQQGARLDPRIKGELDKLNSTSEEINCLEKELDDARQQFRVTLTESSYKLNEAAKRCGKAMKKAKPYHEARIKAHKAQVKVQEATYSYQRAVGMFRAAKETIAIAEDTSMQGNKIRDFDSALQEMLNHATLKLNAAEQVKLRGKTEHEQLSKTYEKAQIKVEQLGKKLRKSIAKSAAYYDLRDAFYSRLENLKESVEKLQKIRAKSKKRYREALRNLERISEDIHQSRRQHMEAALQERSSGVGAESETEPNRESDDDDDDEVVNLETVAESNQSNASVEERNLDSNENTIHPSLSKPPHLVGDIGASGGASSSYSTSPEDDEPQSPILTEHGLPTLRRDGSLEDPDFYRSEFAIAKLPGILPEEQELIEATYRGYRPFDANLTEEEVTVLRKGAGPPVIMVESPEGVVSDPTEDEEELEIYEPEEIEMSEFPNEGSGPNDSGDLFKEDMSSVELIHLEQETRLNGVIDDISPENSEGEESVEDMKNSEGQTPAKTKGSKLEQVSPNDSPVVENGQEETKEQKKRATSIVVEEPIQEDFVFPDPLVPTSPIMQFQVSDLERPGSPALFRYRADKHREEVHASDDTTEINTSLQIIPSDDVTTDEDHDRKGTKCD